ncbi:DUF427 domain-containing protein [Fulvimarina sp. 2208YS6-2-32]|uniref:DUF427 domain-containing protein n=1 Tax=Fulvimarina uroteuthidis TaxID=3098149 RepID=A0ABU5I101_9HYPH|nr:DUF427 domain-containing protein [Fulvimarina sp. 2208YS6-2-32]MDY8109054.1 DUF427 domain-containing protein [Fulvimarina sp. 2208YS6-2-32]
MTNDNLSTADRAGTRAPITIEKAAGPVNVTFNGAVLATTKDALIVRETGHAPVYYFPKDHVEMAFLLENDHRTRCPCKGEARYWNISAEGQGAENAVWAYDAPYAGVEELAGTLAFDASKVTIDDGGASAAGR